MSDATKFFIEPMLETFDGPPGSSPSAFFDALAEELAGFSEKRLSAAVSLLRRTRKYPRFPTFAECVEACRMAVVPGEIAARHIARNESARNADMAIARQLCRCDLGLEADADGWLVTMLEFCEREGRPPANRQEIETCKNMSRMGDEACESLRGGSLFASMEKLRRNMNHRARTEVFGVIEVSA